MIHVPSIGSLNTNAMFGVVACEISSKPCQMRTLCCKEKPPSYIIGEMNPVSPQLVSRLERSIHEPARLAILSYLAQERKGVGFTELKNACELTDGNLSRHVKTLFEAGLVTQQKRTSATAKRQTYVCITDDGLQAFTEYLTVLESILHRAAESLGVDAATEKNSLFALPSTLPRLS